MAEQAPLKKLPLGRQEFDVLRAENMIYVDKTDLIVKLLDVSDFLFLARPRRFGKSLLVSTIASLYRDGVEAFKGLKAEQLWKKGKFPVVVLNFALLKAVNLLDVDEFKGVLDRVLKEAIAKAGFEVSDDPMDPIDRWRQFLGARTVNSVVILIDEYDAPLTAVMDDAKAFENIQIVLRGFFGTLKNMAEGVQFCFITGVMKYRQANLFSSFNNLTDISMDEPFGELLGYTEKELREYFMPHVQEAARVLRMTTEEVMQKLEEYYDGYCFDEMANTHVYVPWSVLSFLSRPYRGFQDYWFESAGTTTVLLNYLKRHKLLSPGYYDKKIRVGRESIEGAEHMQDLKDYALLTHTGYLTIKSAGLLYELGYPNEEVRMAMAKLYAMAYWKADKRGRIAMEFIEALEEGSSEDLLKVLNEVVHQLDYKDFIITNEASIQQLMQIFCIAAGLRTRLEVHSPLGRSDHEIETDHVDVVIEYKYVKDGKVMDALEQAKQQIVTRDYGAPHGNRELRRFALVFDGEMRRFAVGALI